jgi:hypothetical protein
VETDVGRKRLQGEEAVARRQQANGIKWRDLMTAAETRRMIAYRWLELSGISD